MYLLYAIIFSGMGMFWMLGYYNGGGENTVSLILGIICLILGSINGKKYQENKKK